jgi:hypothetical protein
MILPEVRETSAQTARGVPILALQPGKLGFTIDKFIHI